jgi:cytochrome c553
MSARNAFAVTSLPLLLALAAGPAAAQNAAATPPPPEIADQVQHCASCHGANGLPVVEKVPIISGQDKFYLFTALRRFRAGRRVSEIMGPIAKDLSDDQIDALAKYFAAQPWPDFRQSAADTDGEKAKTLAVAGRCTSCHREGFLGHTGTPRVANQKPDYVQQTLTDLRGNVRQEAAVAAMAAIVHSWSDDDIAAMSRYLAGL